MLDSVTTLKVVFIFVLILISLSGLVPFLNKKIRHYPNAISVANCFAAGVFLSLAFVHILPEAVGYYAAAMEATEDHDDHDDHGHDDHDNRHLSEAHDHDNGDDHDDHDDAHAHLFPLIYVMFLAGYLSVLFLDKWLNKHSQGYHCHGEDTSSLEADKAPSPLPSKN